MVARLTLALLQHRDRSRQISILCSLSLSLNITFGWAGHLTTIDLKVVNSHAHLKGSYHKKKFYRPDLIFWIVMGCGKDHFGWKGQTNTPNWKFWSQSLFPGFFQSWLFCQRICKKKNIYIDIFLVLGSHLRGNFLDNGKVIAITVRKRSRIA